MKTQLARHTRLLAVLTVALTGSLHHILGC